MGGGGRRHAHRIHHLSGRRPESQGSGLGAVGGSACSRSPDRGRTWSLADRGPPAGAILTLLPGASTLLAGTQKGSFRSADQGASWNRSSQGLRAASITDSPSIPSGPHGSGRPS